MTLNCQIWCGVYFSRIFKKKGIFQKNLKSANSKVLLWKFYYNNNKKQLKIQVQE
jgi:hypothetical protein